MADLKPGEFLITREQFLRAPWDNEVLEAVSTDEDAFTRAFDGPVDCRGEPLDLGPATRADLAELDAVPEPVDSDAPREVHRATSLTPAARAR